jgi:hypothetical protein
MFAYENNVRNTHNFVGPVTASLLAAAAKARLGRVSKQREVNALHGSFRNDRLRRRPLSRLLRNTISTRAWALARVICGPLAR